MSYGNDYERDSGIRPVRANSDETDLPQVQFCPNGLGSQPFMFIDGESVKMDAWVARVEARLRAIEAALPGEDH